MRHKRLPRRPFWYNLDPIWGPYLGYLGWLMGAQGALFGNRFAGTNLGSHLVPNWEDLGLENVRFLYHCRQNRGWQKINKNSDAFGVHFGSILRPL